MLKGLKFYWIGEINLIEKIYVMADVTRVCEGKDGILKWLGGLMEGIINRICDIPFYEFSNEELKNLHLSLYSAYNIDLSKNNNKKYEFLSVPVDNWVQLCFEEPNDRVLDIVNKYFGNGLVITREPAIILKKSFEILNIPYIDLAIHSVRYMDDIIMGATSNIPQVYDKILNYEVNEEEFYFYADLLKAENRFRNGFPDHINKTTNYALFLAQTPVDRSLLDFNNKKLVSFFDYTENFTKLTEEHELVFYKSHPFYQNDKVIKFLKSFKNVKIIKNIDIYNLFSLPEYKTCASISSGSLKEANYFGKKTICFLDQPYHYSEEIKNKNELNKNIYVTVGKSWLSSSFWADILTPLIKTKNMYKINTDNTHNRLRRILGTSWGYFDSDSTFVSNYFKEIGMKS